MSVTELLLGHAGYLSWCSVGQELQEAQPIALLHGAAEDLLHGAAQHGEEGYAEPQKVTIAPQVSHRPAHPRGMNEAPLYPHGLPQHGTGSSWTSRAL